MLQFTGKNSLKISHFTHLIFLNKKLWIGITFVVDLIYKVKSKVEWHLSVIRRLVICMAACSWFQSYSSRNPLMDYKNVYLLYKPSLLFVDFYMYGIVMIWTLKVKSSDASIVSMKVKTDIVIITCITECLKNIYTWTYFVRCLLM